MSVITNDHLGWMMCDGRALSVDDFYLLFRVIGYSFGGGGDTFLLPNAAGRIPGVVGTGVDSNTSTFTLALGDSVGEYQHTLTIPEMPTHNHGVAPGGQVGSNNTTSSYTHDHGGNTGAGGNAIESETVMGGAGAIVSGSGSHTHTIASDTHSHTINPAGGSLSHNNVQPIIGLGNMFIYCGKTMYPLDGFPYTIGTTIL